MEEIHVLLADDAFDFRDTKKALEYCVEKARQEQRELVCNALKQHKAREEPVDKYAAFLVDNDYGFGIQTLAHLIDQGVDGNRIALVTPLDTRSMQIQYEARGYARQLHPDKLRELGITTIERKGDNRNKEITPEIMASSLHEFLKKFY